MKKIKDSSIIIMGIMHINKTEIEIEELLIYIRKICIYMKNQGYCMNQIDNTSILSFFRMFSYIGIVENDKIIIKQQINDKMKKFFLSNIDENLINNIRNYNKYILPIIIGENVINISFITDDKLLESLRNNFYYDSIKNKAFIIDLEVIKEAIEYKNIILFLEKFLKKETALKKEVLNYKYLNRLFELSYSIKNNEFKNIQESFGLTNEFNKISSIYETLFYYLHIANNNKINLEGNDKTKILDKLTK